MADALREIDGDLAVFLERQPVFFVATAAADGHVNVSPKGLDTFRVLGPRSVAYLDLTGSGIETVAHLRADGRITIMFCAFTGPARIVRLYGRGRFVRLSDGGDHGSSGDDREAADLIARFPAYPGARAVIMVDVERVTSSCGFGVPRLGFEEPRGELVDWAKARGPEGLAAYRVSKNATSIDGFPGW